MPKVIAVFSGGLDSTTMVYELAEQNDTEVECISFYYGQRHRKELEYALVTTQKLNLHYDVVDISSITDYLARSGSSLIDPHTPVPEGHYAEDNMKATVVPNRNMIMLSIAAGIAVARGAECIATAVHAGDHAIYPDCRPQFIHTLGHAIYRGNEGFGNLRKPNWTGSGPVYAPYIKLSKMDIAKKALYLGVPFEDTWSCYKGGFQHCGKCGTCVERLEAINDAIQSILDAGGQVSQGAYDKTEYEDTDYWKKALSHGTA